MARPCTVCHHPQRAAIDEALVKGVAVPAVAAQYRGISEDALQRHRAKHLPKTLAAATQAREVVAGDGLLAEVRRLQEKANTLFAEASTVLRRARRQRDGSLQLDAVRAGAAAVREARGCLTLLSDVALRLAEIERADWLAPADWNRLLDDVEAAIRHHVHDHTTLVAIADELRHLHREATPDSGTGEGGMGGRSAAGA